MCVYANTFKPKLESLVMSQEHQEKESKIRLSIDKKTITLIFIVVIAVAIIIPMLLTREKTAALVNGEKIYLKEIDRTYLQAQQQNPLVTKSEVLNQTIMAHLLLQEAKQRSLQVNQAQVKLTAGNIAQQPDFEVKLKELGMTFEEFEQVLADQFLLQALVNDTVTNIEVTDEEIRNFYKTNEELLTTPESINVSHILIDTREKAESLRVQLAAKQDSPVEFEKLAFENSIDPSAKQNKGNLGIVPKGQFVPEFEAAAFATAAGTITGPIKTQFGYHLILVHNKVSAKKLSFVDAKPFIQEAIKQEKGKSAIQALMQRLYEDADIRWYLKD